MSRASGRREGRSSPEREDRGSDRGHHLVAESHGFVPFYHKNLIAVPYADHLIAAAAGLATLGTDRAIVFRQIWHERTPVPYPAVTFQEFNHGPVRLGHRAMITGPIGVCLKTPSGRRRGWYRWLTSACQDSSSWPGALDSN